MNVTKPRILISPTVEASQSLRANDVAASSKPSFRTRQNLRLVVVVLSWAFTAHCGNILAASEEPDIPSNPDYRRIEDRKKLAQGLLRYLARLDSAVPNLKPSEVEYVEKEKKRLGIFVEPGAKLDIQRVARTDPDAILRFQRSREAMIDSFKRDIEELNQILSNIVNSAALKSFEFTMPAPDPKNIRTAADAARYSSSFELSYIKSLGPYPPPLGVERLIGKSNWVIRTSNPLSLATKQINDEMHDWSRFCEDFLRHQPDEQYVKLREMKHADLLPRGTSLDIEPVYAFALFKSGLGERNNATIAAEVRQILLSQIETLLQERFDRQIKAESPAGASKE